MGKKPGSTTKLFVDSPQLSRFLHECSACHVIGLKPGILATRSGDYGWRTKLAGRYKELHLGEDGLCDRCADERDAQT